MAGTFWFVADEDGTAHLLPEACQLAAAEPYGDRLTFPYGHHETWEAWRGGALPLPAPDLHSVIAADESDEWPRGGVVFGIATGRFVVYADRQLLAPARADCVLSAFALPPCRTMVGADPHYSRDRRLPATDAGA